MIFDGVQLMFLGMGIVFIYLILIVYVIRITGKILNPFTKKEIDLLNEAENRKRRKPIRGNGPSPVDQSIIAAINTTVEAYRKTHPLGG